MLVIQSKKLTITQKISEIENESSSHHGHHKYITTQGFNKLTSENFTTRLAREKLASKVDIASLQKMTDFHDKLNKFNENVTSGKTKHVLIEKI